MRVGAKPGHASRGPEHLPLSLAAQLEPDRPCDLPEKVKIGPLKEWASKDYGW